jgi:hypothetical protein
MANAKRIIRTPLSKAVMRVLQPRIRRRPKIVSATVEINATVRITAAGHVIGKEPWEHTIWVEREYLELETHEPGT